VFDMSNRMREPRVLYSEFLFDVFELLDDHWDLFRRLKAWLRGVLRREVGVPFAAP
jgi:hypothetical protein